MGSPEHPRNLPGIASRIEALLKATNGVLKSWDRNGNDPDINGEVLIANEKLLELDDAYCDLLAALSLANPQQTEGC